MLISVSQTRWLTRWRRLGPAALVLARNSFLILVPAMLVPRRPPPPIPLVAALKLVRMNYFLILVPAKLLSLVSQLQFLLRTILLTLLFCQRTRPGLRLLV